MRCGPALFVECGVPYVAWLLEGLCHLKLCYGQFESAVGKKVLELSKYLSLALRTAGHMGEQ